MLFNLYFYGFRIYYKENFLESVIIYFYVEKILIELLSNLVDYFERIEFENCLIDFIDIYS